MSNMFSSITELLSPYQHRIESALKSNISALGPYGRLREACEYALLSGGKRFRPALVFIIADALNKGIDVSHAALAVEYFHTASLIADDLPCMDNDDQRRAQPSLHKAYDETTALLSTYGLIAEGYSCIAKNVEVLRQSGHQYCDRIGTLALENASYNTGVLGATGGQYLDIFPPNLTLETIQETINKKTVTLFEISFVFGWLFGGGSEKHLDVVKESAKHFGLAFQIADDIGDMEQDAQNGRRVNLAAIFGVEQAKKTIQNELRLLDQKLQFLGINSPALTGLVSLIK